MRSVCKCSCSAEQDSARNTKGRRRGEGRTRPACTASGSNELAQKSVKEGGGNATANADTDARLQWGHRSDEEEQEWVVELQACRVQGPCACVLAVRDS